MYAIEVTIPKVNLQYQKVRSISFTVFCPDYVEWWLDSNLHLVLFTQYILNSVSVAYVIMYYLRGG